MSTQSENEIDDIKIDVLTMASLAQRNLEGAISAVASGDPDVARKVISDDQIINGWLRTIDRKIIAFQALRQPVAKDLLYSIICSRMAIMLEHIGDQTLSISEKVLSRPAVGAEMPSSALLDELCALTLGMYGETVDLFKNPSAGGFQHFAGLEGQAAELTMKILRFYVDFMVTEDRVVERAINMIIISRTLKSVCDYLMNIVESILFVLGGVSVEHVCHPA